MPTGIPTTSTNPKSELVDLSRVALRKIMRYALVIAIGSFLFGYDTRVISGALLFIPSVRASGDRVEAAMPVAVRSPTWDAPTIRAVPEGLC